MFSKHYTVVHRQGSLLLALGLILIIIVQIGCSDDSGGPTGGGDTIGGPNTVDRSPGWQRRLWDSLGSDSYEIDQSRICFCIGPWGPVRLTVMDDSIVAGIVLSDSTAVPPEILSFYLTIPRLLDFIDSAKARQAFEIRAVYDSTLGYPINVWVDYWEYAIDEEMGYDSRNYRPLDQ